MSEAVIDTNVFVHAIAEDSPQHQESRKLLAGLKRWVVPTIVVYELVWVLKRVGVSSEKVVYVVESILRNPRTVVLADFGDYARWALRAVCEEKISLAHFNDKVIIAAAVKTGASLATYDDELRREAMRKGLRVLPPP